MRIRARAFFQKRGKREVTAACWSVKDVFAGQLVQFGIAAQLRKYQLSTDRRSLNWKRDVKLAYIPGKAGHSPEFNFYLYLE
jgi:hypothetical protein